MQTEIIKKNVQNLGVMYPFLGDPQNQSSSCENNEIEQYSFGFLNHHQVITLANLCFMRDFKVKVVATFPVSEYYPFMFIKDVCDLKVLNPKFYNMSGII